MLVTFAERLQHPVCEYLVDVAAAFVANSAKNACREFSQLKNASPELRGIALFDRDPTGMPKITTQSPIEIVCWTRREIENYLCYEEALLQFAENFVAKELKGLTPTEAREIMQLSINYGIPLDAPRDLNHPAWHHLKVSNDFLCPLFYRFFDLVEPGLVYKKTNKSFFAEIIQFLPDEAISDEVAEVLDRILKVARG